MSWRCPSAIVYTSLSDAATSPLLIGAVHPDLEQLIGRPPTSMVDAVLAAVRD